MATVIPLDQGFRCAIGLLGRLDGELCPAADWDSLRQVFDWSPDIGRAVVEEMAQQEQIPLELAMRAAMDDPGAAALMLAAMARWNSRLRRTDEMEALETEAETFIEFMGAAWDFFSGNPPLESAVKALILENRTLALHLLRRKDPEGAVALSLRTLEELRSLDLKALSEDKQEEWGVDYRNILLNLAMIRGDTENAHGEDFGCPCLELEEDFTEFLTSVTALYRDISPTRVVKLILEAGHDFEDTATPMLIWAVMETGFHDLLPDAALFMTEHITIDKDVHTVVSMIQQRLCYYLQRDFADLSGLFSDQVMSNVSDQCATLRHLDTGFPKRILKNFRMFLSADIIRQTHACLDDPRMVPFLTEESRGTKDATREMAIRMMAYIDDPRCASEMLACLNDSSPKVRETAQYMLLDETSPMAFMDGWDRYRRSRWVHEKHSAIQRIYTWGDRVGREMTGRGSRIMTYQTGIGKTRDAKFGPMEIEINDLPIISDHVHGESVVKGILVHEIAHHMFDTGVRGSMSARGQADKHGVRPLYDVLRDERIERLMRGRRPSFGPHLDRLLAYAFTELRDCEVPLKALAETIGEDVDDLRRDFETGRHSGHLRGDTVRLSALEQLMFTSTVGKEYAFYFTLRSGFAANALPLNNELRAAMELITPNFKDTNHHDLVRLAIRIKDALGIKGPLNNPHGSNLQLLRRLLPALDQALKKLSEIGGHLIGGMDDGRINRQGRVIRNYGKPFTPPSASKQRGSDRMQATARRVARYTHLDRVEKLHWEERLQQEEVRRIRPYVRRLRAFMEKAGTRTVEDRGVRRGQRFDQQGLRRSLANPGAGLFVNRQMIQDPDTYVGLLIDRSGSMDGQRIELARSFGVLLTEAMKDLRGINGHVHAFDDDTLYDLGNFQRNAIASLEAGGGNNDCGALHYAANLAKTSMKKNRLLIMISDGSPTDGCCPESLRLLVQELETAWNIQCVQVAVRSIDNVSFPKYVDLSSLPYGEAVIRFGRLIQKLAAKW